MNYLDFSEGDFVTTDEGYTCQVVSIDGAYVCLRTSTGDRWFHQKQIVAVND
jgi:hypothetical protein